MAQAGNAGGSRPKANPPDSQNMNQEKFEELKKLIGEQETRIQALQASEFQLANFYFVFQGVVFAAISNSPSLTCSDSWFVFTPSLLAAVLNLFALFSIGSKYTRAMNLHDMTWFEYNRYLRAFSSRNINQTHERRPWDRTLAFTGVYSPRNTNSNGRINDGANVIDDDDDEFEQNWVDILSQWRRYVLLIACMVLFIAFTVVTLSGPWAVVCKHNKHRRRMDQNDDCLQLCDGSKCLSFCHRS